MRVNYRCSISGNHFLHNRDVGQTETILILLSIVLQAVLYCFVVQPISEACANAVQIGKAERSTAYLTDPSQPVICDSSLSPSKYSVYYRPLTDCDI